MPNEVLLTIIDFAGTKALPALRQTNKRLRDVSNERYAKLHFAVRRHVQSEYSMDALVDITAHSIFGGYVKTIITSDARPKQREEPLSEYHPRSCTQCTLESSSPLCEHPAPYHIALSFERLRVKLEKVFHNIRRHSASVSVGVRESVHECYGNAYYHADCAMISKVSPNPIEFLRQRDECKHFVQTFQETLQAARKSGCEIENTKFYAFHPGSPFMRSTRQLREMEAMLDHFLASLSNSVSFELNWFSSQKAGLQAYIRYDHNIDKLDVCGLIFTTFIFQLRGFLPDAEATRMLSRLSNQSMVCIRLSECRIENFDFPQLLCIPTLESLTLHDVVFDTEHLGTNLWSSFFKQLYHTTRLRQLELDRCQYGFNPARDHGDKRRWLQLPSGRYPMDDGFGDDSRFFLLFSHDAPERKVLTHTTSILAELKALAEEVAHLELEEIADIERDGCVRTNIIGISKHEPPEVTVLGEDDHGRSKKGEHGETGETSGFHANHPEHDNHNLLETAE